MAHMGKVLIVEDSLPFRRFFRNLLCSQYPNLVVVETNNGFQVLDQIKNFSPDIVFMDIRLPGPNGLLLTRQIKKAQPSTKVIILTSHFETEFRKRAALVGADYFLCKDELNSDILRAILKFVFVY